MVIRRDPVSEQFDAAARKLLRRAYANPGHWTGTYLGRPPVVWRAWATYHGIGLEERDRWGEVRWVRAFKRSVYWNLAWYGGAAELRSGRRTAPGGAKALVWETGKLVMKPGWPGRRYAIRIKLMPGGPAAYAAVQAKREAKRYTDTPAYRSTLADRDY